MIDNEYLEPGFIGQNPKEAGEKDWKKIQEIIGKHADQLSKEELMENRLISIKLRMEDYLRHKKPETIKHSGHFLKEILETLGIKNNVFSNYIGYQKSNLSSIFSGKRNMNFEFALKLYEIFGIEPELWLYIQIKNDLKKIEGKKEGTKKYDLKDLIGI